MEAWGPAVLFAAPRDPSSSPWLKTPAGSVWEPVRAIPKSQLERDSAHNQTFPWPCLGAEPTSATPHPVTGLPVSVTHLLALVMAAALLTHPDLSELPRSQLFHQLESLPRHLPFILPPGLLRLLVLAGLAQAGAESICIACRAGSRGGKSRGKHEPAWKSKGGARRMGRGTAAMARHYTCCSSCQ